MKTSILKLGAVTITLTCAAIPAAQAQIPAAVYNLSGLTHNSPFNRQSAPAQFETVQYLEDIGASQRVDLSGKLRMLSQRIPAAACNFAAGIDTDATGAMLKAAAAEFQQIVDALEFGDESLGIIGAEERRKTRVGLRKLRELWEPMSATATAIADGDSAADTLTQLATQSEAVLEMAKLLVSEISGQYADPTALLQADALIIDIAGRQRMLSQRMSKNICLIASGISVDAATAQLSGTAQMFDASLGALRNGMADAGIKPPPNAEIEAGLDVVIADWAQLQPIVAATLAGEAINNTTRSDMFNGANVMTGHMNSVVGLYSEASKLGL